MSMEPFQAARWQAPGSAAHGECCFTRDGGEAPEAFAGLHVVAPNADEERIGLLLAAGAVQVLVGEPALGDGALIGRLVDRHGADRIGLWLPVRRAPSQWGFDRESNADFSFVSAGCPVPRWLVLRADRSQTDVDAVWWAQQMTAAGAASVLVTVDRPEDDDLVVCAGMVEALGERLWFNADGADAEELYYWTRYGQVRNLVVEAGADAPVLLATLRARLPEQGAAA